MAAETLTLPNAQVIDSLVPFNGQLKKVWGATMYHLNDVAGVLGPMGVKGMPDVFTPFKDKVQRGMTSFPDEPVPSTHNPYRMDVDVSFSSSIPASPPCLTLLLDLHGQVERKLVAVRKLVPPPAKGDLPLPKAAVSIHSVNAIIRMGTLILDHL